MLYPGPRNDSETRRVAPCYIVGRVNDPHRESNLILRVRSAAGLTQSQMAAVIGVNRISVLRWENNPASIPPPVLALFKLIEAAPETSLAVLGEDKPKASPASRAKAPRPQVKTVVPASPKPSQEPTGFNGAGAPPERRKSPSDLPERGEIDSDSWRFGF